MRKYSEKAGYKIKVKYDLKMGQLYIVLINNGYLLEAGLVLINSSSLFENCQYFSDFHQCASMEFLFKNKTIRKECHVQIKVRDVADC